MRKLILQMQMSVDGFMAATRPDVAWQVWNWGTDWPWDDRLKRYFNTVFESVDTILLSRMMVEDGYLDHWAHAADTHLDDPYYAFARRIGAVDKVVVTGAPPRDQWPRTRMAVGDLATEVGGLKRTSGQDIICFGGVGFAAALVTVGLIDEYQLFVNPTAVGSGRSIFDGPDRDVPLDLAGSTAYDCGIVVNRYVPRIGRPGARLG